MPPVVYPTEWVLGNFDVMPSEKHDKCFELRIKPLVMNPKDVTKVRELPSTPPLMRSARRRAATADSA